MLNVLRDYQRERVYAWEREHVYPADGSQVPYAQIPAIVNYVWENEGLKYPPTVGVLPKHKKCSGDADRLELRFHDHKTTRTSIILHEIAHAMTADFEDGSNLHGPLFVGVYIKLLEKYAKQNLLILMATAKMKNVDFDIMAQPEFVD